MPRFYKRRRYSIVLVFALATAGSLMLGKLGAAPGPGPVPDCVACNCRDVECFATGVAPSIVFYYFDNLGKPQLSSHAITPPVYSTLDRCQPGTPTPQTANIFWKSLVTDYVCEPKGVWQGGEVFECEAKLPNDPDKKNSVVQKLCQ